MHYYLDWSLFFNDVEDPLSLDESASATQPRPSRCCGPWIRCKCGRKYTRLSDLVFHKRWECGRTFECMYCTKMFKNLLYYRRHIKQCE